jgi:hypothetical protein
MERGRQWGERLGQPLGRSPGQHFHAGRAVGAGLSTGTAAMSRPVTAAEITEGMVVGGAGLEPATSAL